MKKTITLLTLMFISIIGYADDFNQYKILPQLLRSNTDDVYIQNVNMNNKYLALDKRQGDLGTDSSYYNIVFDSVGTKMKLIRVEDRKGVFYLDMQPEGDDATYRLAVLLDEGYKLVAVNASNKGRIPYPTEFSAYTLNEDNSRVAWYTDVNGSIARSHNGGKEVVFDKEKVNSRDSRRWNFFIRPSDHDDS